MNTQSKSVKELFAPLGQRLFEFESGRYLHHSVTLDIYGEHDSSNSGLVYEIGKLANTFDAAEVYAEALPYVDRIKMVLNSLQPVQSESVYMPDVEEHLDLDAEPSPVPEERKQELMQRHQHELNTFLKDLEAILKARPKPVSNGATAKEVRTEKATIPQPIIELPKDFTVSQLNKQFNPQLSVNQAALFLYYLREQAILPPYSDSAIGKLAEAFFVRNQKNITKSLTDIYTVKRTKDDLDALRQVLQTLLKEVENDLKEAR